MPSRETANTVINDLAERLGKQMNCEVKVHKVTKGFYKRGELKSVLDRYDITWNRCGMTFTMQVKSHQYVKKILSGMIDMVLCGIIPSEPVNHDIGGDPDEMVPDPKPCHGE